MGVTDAGLCYKNHVTEIMTWQGVAGVGRKRRDMGCSLPGGSQLGSGHSSP